MENTVCWTCVGTCLMLQDISRCISWEISGTIPGICCLVHYPTFLHAVDISQVHFQGMTLSPLVLVRLLSSSRLSIVAAYPAVK